MCMVGWGGVGWKEGEGQEGYGDKEKEVEWLDWEKDKESNMGIRETG